jgi:NAD-dependent deacetylase
VKLADDTEQIERLAELLRNSSCCVAFTGAGISTESGIPDFRSPGGIWSRRRTVMFDEFQRSAEARLEYWDQKAEAHTEISRAEPNIAHRLLAHWEQLGRLAGVITQNIDGLHVLAGSRNVLELHGTARRIQCLSCRWSSDADHWVAGFRESRTVPDCPDCGGLLKHATISFGQMLDQSVLERSADMAGSADVFLVLGSSLVVEPAATLPALAHHHGAELVILNRDPTPHDRLASVVLRAELGATMASLAARLPSEWRLPDR